MYLTKHLSADGPRWALDGGFLPPQVGLDLLLQLPKPALGDFLRLLPRTAAPAGQSCSGRRLAGVWRAIRCPSAFETIADGTCPSRN